VGSSHGPWRSAALDVDTVACRKGNRPKNETPYGQSIFFLLKLKAFELKVVEHEVDTSELFEEILLKNEVEPSNFFFFCSRRGQVVQSG
jgi:hypothetical protein